MLKGQERHNEGTLAALISKKSLVQQDGFDNHTHEGKLARAYNITQRRRLPVGADHYGRKSEGKKQGKKLKQK